MWKKVWSHPTLPQLSLPVPVYFELCRRIFYILWEKVGHLNGPRYGSPRTSVRAAFRSRWHVHLEKVGRICPYSQNPTLGQLIP